MRRLAMIVAALSALSIVPHAAPGSAVIRLPKPGSASHVASLVATSSSITRLPHDLLPPLRSVGADAAAHFYPAAKYSCTGATQCVFGDGHRSGRRSSSATHMLICGFPRSHPMPSPPECGWSFSGGRDALPMT